MVISADVLKNHVLSLHANLSADELEQIKWLAESKRAALLNLPAPVRPGFGGWVDAKWRAFLRAIADRKQFVKMVQTQADRIEILEGLLTENGIEVPDA